eukprot:1867942-Pleurochrysis_carterae.AAC.4
MTGSLWQRVSTRAYAPACTGLRTCPRAQTSTSACADALSQSRTRVAAPIAHLLRPICAAATAIAAAAAVTAAITLAAAAVAAAGPRRRHRLPCADAFQAVDVRTQ